MAAADRTDIVVGIPSFNSAATIGRVVSAVDLGLTKYFPESAAVIVNSDGGSKDGTPDVVRGARSECHTLPAAPLAEPEFTASAPPTTAFRQGQRCCAPSSSAPGPRCARLSDRRLRSAQHHPREGRTADGTGVARAVSTDVDTFGFRYDVGRNRCGAQGVPIRSGGPQQGERHRARLNGRAQPWQIFHQTGIITTLGTPVVRHHRVVQSPGENESGLVQYASRYARRPSEQQADFHVHEAEHRFLLPGGGRPSNHSGSGQFLRTTAPWISGLPGRVLPGACGK